MHEQFQEESQEKLVIDHGAVDEYPVTWERFVPSGICNNPFE